MGDPAKRRATYEDLLAVPDRLVAEIIDGELHTQPRPMPRHARVIASLVRQLGPFDDDEGKGPGGWIILPEPEVHFLHGVAVPDIAGWRLERMAAIPDTHIDVVPNWACEVISPGTRIYDLETKVPFYAREGVEHIWIVDPIERSLVALRLEGTRYEGIGQWFGDARPRVPPFDAIELRLAVLWAR